MTTWLVVLGCVVGTALVAFLLAVAMKITPLVLGGLVIVVGIYQGVQIGGQWGLIVGVSCGVGGTIYLLFQLASGTGDEDKKEEPLPPEPKETEKLPEKPEEGEGSHDRPQEDLGRPDQV